MRDQAIALKHPARQSFEEAFGPVERFFEEPRELGFDVLHFDDYLAEHFDFDPFGNVSTRDFVVSKTNGWVADWLLHLVAPQSLPLPPPSLALYNHA